MPNCIIGCLERAGALRVAQGLLGQVQAARGVPAKTTIRHAQRGGVVAEAGRRSHPQGGGAGQRRTIQVRE